MHPELLKRTVEACREYMAAGDCHGEAPPTERLIAAVVEMDEQVSQLARALRAEVEPPIFMGEPVVAGVSACRWPECDCHSPQGLGECRKRAAGVQGLRHQGIPPSPAADPQPDSVHSAQPEGQEVTAREAGLIATLRQARDALALVLAEPVGDGIRVSQRISAEMEHGAKHVIAAINEALQEPPCSS